LSFKYSAQVALLQAFHQELIDILKVAAVPFHKLISGTAEGHCHITAFIKAVHKIASVL